MAAASQNVLKVGSSNREESYGFRCKDESHWKSVEDIGFHENVESAVETIRKNRAAKAVYVNVERAPELEPLFTAIAENCTEIEHFEVAFVFGKISESSISIVLKAFNEKLKHFIVNESRNKCEMYPPGSRRPSAFGNDTIIELFGKCPKLELLVLNSGTCVNGEGLLKMPKTLKSLYLPASWWNEQQMIAFAPRNGSYIENFELMATEEPQFKLICENMVNLKTLTLRTLQLQSADPILLLSNLRNLEDIEIGLSNICIDEQLLKVLPNLTRLKRVFFTLCGITDKSLSLFPKYCPELEHIYIYNYNEDAKVTDLSIKALSELTNLRTLCIPQAKVSKECVRDLKSKCTNVDTTLNEADN